MKFGPLYMLRTKSWLYLMHHIQTLLGENQKLTDRLRQFETKDEPPTPAPTRGAMLRAMSGWVTRYEIDGIGNDGTMALYEDGLLAEHLALVGGVAGKRVLELGPMEAAHTRVLCEAGAQEVVAVEGFRKCFLKCLVAKEAFDLTRAKFLYGDFCQFAEAYDGPRFDVALARGVLYHQTNPAALIRNLARISDTVFVWSQVADGSHPGGPETTVATDGKTYRGRFNDYGGVRNLLASYCGGVHDVAVWLYADELRRAFRDVGFTHLVEGPTPATPHGPCVQFVASKAPLVRS
jgi:hypothetical protein